MKTCSKCGVFKEFSEFGRQGPGFRAECKECRYQIEKARLPTHKICSVCKIRKPRTEFHRRSDRGPNGVVSHCKVCQLEKHQKYMASPEAKAADRKCHNDAYANDPALREKRREQSRKDAPKKRVEKLKRLYGMTVESWTALLESQGGVCAICKGPQSMGRKGFCTDHDHVTGTVRGILCHSCNVAIGHLRDSADLVLAALDYLRKQKHPRHED